MYGRHQAGATLKQVGEEFGVYAGTVSKLFKDAGLNVRVHRSATTRIYPTQQMYALYEDGATLEEIARQHGISTTTVSHLFKRAGFKIRPRGSRRNQPSTHEMYRYYQTGATLTATGEHFGVDASHLSQLFKAAGLKARRPGPQRKQPSVHEMYEHYQTGATLRGTAETFGVALTDVSKAFETAGLQTRPRGGDRQIDTERVDAMYKQYQEGATLKEVGADHGGITRERVRQLFKRAGLQTRTRALAGASRPSRTGAAAGVKR